jgi:NAD(P)-dependent dehydrogenase (short-subunit alcohol dehydrogenase family)
LALASAGYDVVVTYRNKAVRANEIVMQLEQRGGCGLAVACDVTKQDDVVRLYERIMAWSGTLDVLILNASGGLERDLVAADPAYPMHINRDAQVAMLDGALPLMRSGGRVVFITSHWAHLYGEVQQIPAYAPVAESKHAGEVAIRARLPELTELGISLIVVTGDLIEGTITPKLLARSAPSHVSQWREGREQLPTVEEMGQAIAEAATDASLKSGATIVVGRSLDAIRDESAE